MQQLRCSFKGNVKSHSPLDSTLHDGLGMCGCLFDIHTEGSNMRVSPVYFNCLPLSYTRTNHYVLCCAFWMHCASAKSLDMCAGLKYGFYLYIVDFSPNFTYLFSNLPCTSALEYIAGKTSINHGITLKVLCENIQYSGKCLPCISVGTN